MKTRVFLVDDRAPVLKELSALLGDSAEIEVVGMAKNGREAVKQVKTLKPDIVVMDVALPCLNGVEATRQMRQSAPEVRVVLVSAPRQRNRLSEAIQAGAAGYFFEDDLRAELIQGIHQVLTGKTYFSHGVSEMAIADYVRRAADEKTGAELEKLTNREREILMLIAEGKSSTEVARDLHISSHTVDTHRRHIMEKLNLHSLAGLIKFAIRNGLTSLD